MKADVGTKNERRQRIAARKRRKRATEALAAAAVIAGGTQAYAAPVRFENPPHGDPGHFHWPGDVPAPYLDVTLPAADQTGDYYSIPSAFAHRTNVFGGSRVYTYRGYGFQATTFAPSSGWALGFNFADAIPNPSGVCYTPYTYPPKAFCFSINTGLDYYCNYYPDICLPEGETKYLGVAWGPNQCVYNGNSCTYGWIAGVRTGQEFEVSAWGYEPDGNGTPVCAGASAADPNCQGGGEPIPTVSEWGLGIMGLLGLAAGTIVFGKRTGRAGEVAV